MTTNSTLTKILDAIAAAVAGDPDATPVTLATSVLTTIDGELVRELASMQLLILVRAARRAARRRSKADDPYQPFFEGFRSLSARLPLQDSSYPLRLATIPLLRRSLATLRRANKEKADNDPKTLSIQRVIDKMMPFAEGRSRAFTFERYCELAAAGMTPAGKRRRASQSRQKRA